MKAVDLFAGCGGMSLGFQNAGFDIVAAFEFWDIAAECYAKNFSHPVFRTDLSDVDLAVKQISAFSPDLIIGGPPCQDFLMRESALNLLVQALRSLMQK